MIIGYNVETREPYDLDVATFLKTHTLMQAITGAGKTGSIITLIEKLRSPEVFSRFGYIPVMIVDDRANFIDLPKTFKDFRVLDSTGKYKDLFKIDEAESSGKRVREISPEGVSMILKTADFETIKEKEEFVAKFLKGFRIQDRKHWTPCLFIIDEADIYVPTTGKGGRKNSLSREPIIDACKRARQEGIAILLSTQHSSGVHIDARRELDNRLIGNTVEDDDRVVASKMLGDKTLYDKLWGMPEGQFYARGKAFGYDLKRIKIDKPKSEIPIGIQTGNDEVITTVDAMTIPSDGNVIQSMEKQITLLTAKELTQQKYNEILEKGRLMGIREALRNYKQKSLADRLLKR